RLLGLPTPSGTSLGRLGGAGQGARPPICPVLTDCSQIPLDGAGLLATSRTDRPCSEYRASPLRTPRDRLDRGVVAGGQGVAGSNPASPNNLRSWRLFIFRIGPA